MNRGWKWGCFNYLQCTIRQWEALLWDHKVLGLKQKDLSKTSSRTSQPIQSLHSTHRSSRSTRNSDFFFNHSIHTVSSHTPLMPFVVTTQPFPSWLCNHFQRWFPCPPFHSNSYPDTEDLSENQIRPLLCWKPLLPFVTFMMKYIP